MACQSEVLVAVINAQMRLGVPEIAAALNVKKKQKLKKAPALKRA